MIIRREQLAAFQPDAEARFIKKVVGYLLEEYGHTPVRFPRCEVRLRNIPDEVLRQMVSRGVARARGYGMAWEANLAAFVSLMFVASPNFDEHPVIRHILQDKNEPAESRIDLLWEKTSDDNWSAAEENYDPGAWEVDFQVTDE